MPKSSLIVWGKPDDYPPGTLPVNFYTAKNQSNIRAINNNAIKKNPIKKGQ